jgi:predicted transposase YbfD/YdcC
VLCAEKHLLPISGIKQVAKLVRTREILKKSGKNRSDKSSETVYLITNLSFEQASADQLLALKTQYWGIENKVHYVADNVFGEDRCTIRKGHGPRNMSALRMFAMNVMRACRITNIKRCVYNLRSNPLKLFSKAA